tara:strand:- start:4683 stop:4937 length:255 start_codon:yes stop_codon:yes gene_type:complete
MSDDYGLTNVSNGGWILVDHDNGDVAAFTCMADLAEYFEAIEGAPIGVAPGPLWGDETILPGRVTEAVTLADFMREMMADKKKG